MHQNMLIELSANFGFKWYEHDDIYFKGYFFYKGELYEKLEAINLLYLATKKDALENEIKKFSGQFSFIIHRDEETILGVDRLRNFPLFYRLDRKHVTDALWKYHDELNYEHFNHYLSTGFCLGPNTLFRHYHQVEASTIVKMSHKGIQKTPYYQHMVRTTETKKNATEKELRGIINSIFERYKPLFQDRELVLSLSGGFDSRLIALMLKKCSIENVITFTYGKENNPDKSIAKQVANTLGYKWIDIIYNQTISDGFLKDPTFLEYKNHAANSVSFPYLQDYFAVNYLNKNQLISENAVFLTGHSADMLSGGHLRGRFNRVSSFELANQLVKEDYLILSRNKTDYRIPQPKDYEKLLAYSIYEDWDIKERQSKMIVNSSKVYDYFGHQYYLPLWDNQLIDFFKYCPLSLKNDNKLYRQVVLSMFEQNNLFFKQDLKRNLEHRELFSKIKETVKNVLPRNVVLALRNQDNKNHAYDIFTTSMKKQILNQELTYSCTQNYNSIVTHWYLSTLLNK